VTAAAAPAGRARTSRRGWALFGLAPFAVYVLLFLAVPTLIAIGTGFLDGEGRFTLENLTALGEGPVLTAFWNSIWVSAVTAVIGAVVGALVCWALLAAKPDGILRTAVDAVASTLSQFGGVMLAFAFIAAIGIQGLITRQVAEPLGIDLFGSGQELYQVQGILLPYLYFQIPLMVITFLPAMEGLKPQWAEANATLGGTNASYWIRIAGPVLLPSFLSGLVLLFANSFSSYATAAALISQGAQIVPLQIRAALISETVLGRENVAGALALGMVIVMAVLMSVYSLLQRRAERWRR
jgi:putative spermidine/putrescine transport system permease protein